MRHTLKIIGFLSLTFLTQCATSGATLSQNDGLSGPADGTAATTDEVLGGAIEPLSPDSGSSSKALNLGDIGENDSVILELHTTGGSDSGRPFQIGATTQSASESAFLTDVSEPEMEDDTESFHGMLRDWEQELDPADVVSSSSSSRFLTTPASVGDTRVFHVLSSFASNSGFEDVTAVLAYENSVFEFYVDERDVSRLSSDDLQKIATKFSSVIPAEHNLFGHESDIDGNGKFAVLFTRVVNGLGGSSGGMITGFFYAIDLFDADKMAGSNETEVIYTFVPDAGGELGPAVSKSFAMNNIYPGVLPHELQHMINYNERVFVGGGDSEKSFLNEGLSHLAEDLYSLDASGFMERTGLENPSRVATYLNAVDSTCFTCGSRLAQRGGSYLFLRYLYEQAELGNLSGVTDGAAFIGNLMSPAETGIDNIAQAVFGPNPPQKGFLSLLGKFALAVYYSNTGVHETDENQFLGIDLRALQKDNRGTVLNGPAVRTITQLPFTGNVPGTGIGFLKISGKQLKETGGKLLVDFGKSIEFDGAIIRE